MPVPVPLDQLLLEMHQKEVSDLFLAPGAPPRFSLHGNMVDAIEQPLSPDDTVEYAQSLFTPQQSSEFSKEGEINISYSLPNICRYRVNVYTQRGSTALVIRRINMTIPRLESLGLPESLGRLIMADRGLVLVTGATGSGKSTTLAAMIDYRNERTGGHIITIEDPIEFIFRHRKSLITQREVGVDTKSFHTALKNTLRQAPKVIYIGEIRDAETMEFALHASETGHLVLATLHSNNANQTLERIMGFFPVEHHPQILHHLSLNLRAVISQRLVKKVGGGRVPALEVLINTPFAAELIAKGDVGRIKSLMNASTAEGMQTFDGDIHRLWREGQITEEAAFQNADSANNLRLRMRGIAVSS